MPLSQEREIQSSVSSRFAAGVTLPPGRYMCVGISCSCLLQSGWPVVFSRGCGLNWLVVRTPARRCVPSLWRDCSNLLAFPVWFNCWFPGVATVGYLRSMEQDAQYEVGSTERCVFSMLCSLCGKEVECRHQSYAQFVASVISNAAARTTFLHFEPARDCSSVYFVSDAVFFCPLQL